MRRRGISAKEILVSRCVEASGSTGEPKGVIKDHKSITMSVIGHGKAFSVDSNSRVFQFAAHIWAISIYDFFSTLAHGGCICIPSENDRINKLYQTMRKFGITHATLAPSVVSNIITPDQVPSLRVLILGGEPVLRANMEHWSESTRLFSNYGTTETLCAATIELNKSSSSSTAGLPSSVNRCWITHPDDPNRLMPAGGVGELLVESFTVATGYLKDETKSRESFIKAPAWFRGVTNVWAAAQTRFASTELETLQDI
jgi:acyl-coenzyme A synthetase/AMP-(fatty) acid ligase